MATGGKFSTSLSRGSEEIFEYECTPCSKDGNIIEAVKQCLDCNEYYCGKCIRLHDNFATTSSHTVVDKKQMRKVASSKPTLPLPTQRCQDHHERVTTYCADHDVICCNTCVSISHKNCDGITFIVDVAQGIKSGSQLKSAKTNITATLKDLKKEMVLCKKYMADLVNDKTSTVQQVNDLTERLIKRIRELETLTVQQIDSKFKDQSDEAGADVTHLDAVISVMDENLKNLDQSKQNSESTVFVDVKLGQRHEADDWKILQQIGAHSKACPRLLLKTDVDQFVNSLSTLGDFPDVSKVYKAELKGEYNIKVQQDTKICDGDGSCFLPDGTLVVTNCDNKRLKRLNACYRVTDHCDMPDKPCGVTCTAPDEVAVTLTFMKKVQFVSVRGSMSMTRSFSTSGMCSGICCSAGELFVACGGWPFMEEGPGHVSVYNLSCTHLRTIQTDPSGQQVFTRPYHITASPDGSRIYVADNTCGVVSSDRSGKSVSSFTDPSLEEASGVCTLDNGHMLVCGSKSNNVLQFDSNGRKVTELLKHADGIHEPQSLCYDKTKSRLIVTMNDTNKIKVFDLA